MHESPDQRKAAPLNCATLSYNSPASRYAIATQMRAAMKSRARCWVALTASALLAWRAGSPRRSAADSPYTCACASVAARGCARARSDRAAAGPHTLCRRGAAARSNEMQAPQHTHHELSQHRALEQHRRREGRGVALAGLLFAVVVGHLSLSQLAALGRYPMSPKCVTTT